jgi:uncharacterized protein
VGFSFSANSGRLLENLVYLRLRQQYKQVYYYQTKNNLEVDFYVPEKKLAIQASLSLDNEVIRNREVRSLVELSKEIRGVRKIIVTEAEEDVIKSKSGRIQVTPLYRWLL